MANPISLSVKVSCGNQESVSSYFLKMFLNYIIQMSLQQQLLAYFDQPAIHSRICHYA